MAAVKTTEGVMACDGDSGKGGITPSLSLKRGRQVDEALSSQTPEKSVLVIELKYEKPKGEF